jgi:O-antigen/teichoic acid export membrane protein
MQSIFLHFADIRASLMSSWRREAYSIKRHRLLSYNLFFITFERLLQAIALFYCLGVLTQNMSQADYGKFNYALSLGGIFMTISLFAGAELILPKLSRYRYLRSDILTTGFYLRLVYALVSLLAIYAYQLYHGLALDVFWICLGFCFANVIVEVPSILGCWLILEQKNTWFSSARLLGLLAKLLSFAYLSSLGLSHLTAHQNYLAYYVFVLPYIIEGFVSVIAIVIAFMICKHKSQINWQKKIKTYKVWGAFKINIAKRLIKDGFIIGLALTAFFILQRIDRIILEQKIDFQTLGVYGNAMMINDAWLNIGLNICSLLAPALIYKIYADNRLKMLNALSRMIKRCIFYLSIYSILGVILTYLFAEKIMIWQFGENYRQSIWILQIAVCLAPLLLINQMYTFAWLHLKKYYIQFAAWLLPCVLMYLFNRLNILQISSNAITQMLFAWFMSYLGMWGFQHTCLWQLRKTKCI